MTEKGKHEPLFDGCEDCRKVRSQILYYHRIGRFLCNHCAGKRRAAGEDLYSVRDHSFERAQA